MNRENSGGDLYPLRGLQELHLFPEPPVAETKIKFDLADEEPLERYSEWYSGKCKLLADYVWPTFYIPELRVLSLFDLNAENAASLLNSACLLNLESLCLVCHESSSCTAADIQALITQPEHLKSFSFGFRTERYKIKNIISNIEVWEALQQKHKHSLEIIDFYGLHPDRGHQDIDYFGLLREFTSLKDLSIPNEALFAGCCHPHGAAFRLKDTLPPNLKSLTIYAGEYFRNFSDLIFQLQEVVHSPEEFPFLESIILEYPDGNYASIILEHPDGTDEVVPERQMQYKALEQACLSKNISFRTEEGDDLSKGRSRQGNWYKRNICKTAERLDATLLVSRRYSKIPC